MRSQQLSIDINPVQIVFPNMKNKIFMVRNLSAVDTIYVQWGANGGLTADAWPVLAGEVFTLDPAAPVDSIFIWGSVLAIPNRVVLG
jgi:hypothetical protein